MNPIDFRGSNTVFASNQPEYLALPAHSSRNGVIVTTCWHLSWRERLTVLWTGVFWWQQLTFGQPLQPQLPSVKNPLDEIKK